jgi:hypothetical protein
MPRCWCCVAPLRRCANSTNPSLLPKRGACMLPQRRISSVEGCRRIVSSKDHHSQIPPTHAGLIFNPTRIQSLNFTGHADRARSATSQGVNRSRRARSCRPNCRPNVRHEATTMAGSLPQPKPRPFPGAQVRVQEGRGHQHCRQCWELLCPR